MERLNPSARVCQHAGTSECHHQARRGNGKAWRISPAPGGNLNPLAGISHEPRGAREGLLVLRGWVAGTKVAVAGVPQYFLPVFDELRSDFKYPGANSSLLIAEHPSSPQERCPWSGGDPWLSPQRSPAIAGEPRRAIRNGADRAIFGVQCEHRGWDACAPPRLCNQVTSV